jgi:hypothetical protein
MAEENIKVPSEQEKSCGCGCGKDLKTMQIPLGVSFIVLLIACAIIGVIIFSI